MKHLGPVLCTMIAGLLLACGPAQQAGTPGQADPNDRPQRGGTFVVPVSGAPETLHPYTQNKSLVLRSGGPSYETLVSFKYERPPDLRWDINFEIVPWLAERWEQPDPATYIFHLRRGVKWHDGVDMMADDVVFSFNYLRDPQNGFSFRSNLADVASVDKVDDYTIKVATRGPSPFFLETIAPNGEVNIIPRHVVERGDDLNKVQVGSGAFKLKEFDRTRAGVFTRNENYWQPDRPYVDGVQIVYGLDDPARLAGYVTGKFDVMSLPDRLQLDAMLPSKRDAQYAKNINALGVAVQMKQDIPPFNDIRVRRALHLALDRQELNKVAALGEGAINPPATPAIKEGWAIPQDELMKLPGYRQPKDQDLTEAKRLLAEAGYPNGFRSTLSYSTNAAVNRAVAEPLAAQYAKLGVNLTINALAAPDQLRLVRSGEYAMTLEPMGDMNVARYQWDHLHTGGPLATSGFSDPELDRVLETQRSSLNIEDRKRAVRAMQQLLLDKVYVIPTVDIPTYQLWQPWVRNYNYDQGGQPLVGQHNLPWVWLDPSRLPSDRR